MVRGLWLKTSPVCVGLIVVSATRPAGALWRRGAGAPARACVRVYARVLVPQNLYQLYTHICTYNYVYLPLTAATPPSPSPTAA